MSDLHDDRMRRFSSSGLYLVTSGNLSKGRSTSDIIKAALAGGLQLLQLREKDLQDDEFLKLAREARMLTDSAGALLIINDNLDIAIECGADGVHLGLDDYPVSAARTQVPDMIIGSSSHSLGEALVAQESGASYVNIGPVYPTKTKEWDGEYLGVEAIKEIGPKLSIPFTVMGGIKEEHISVLMAAGAQTIALVTAVTAAEDPEQATRSLIQTIRTAC